MKITELENTKDEECQISLLNQFHLYLSLLKRKEQEFQNNYSNKLFK